MRGPEHRTIVGITVTYNQCVVGVVIVTDQCMVREKYFISDDVAV
jgi:hypothetical protein